MINKYIVYATNDDGEGITQKIGEYENLEDINIHIGMFTHDVVISIADESWTDEDDFNETDED